MDYPSISEDIRENFDIRIMKLCQQACFNLSFYTSSKKYNFNNFSTDGKSDFEYENKETSFFVEPGAQLPKRVGGSLLSHKVEQPPC